VAVRFIAGETAQAAAEAVSDEIVRLLSGATVRDRVTGVARAAAAADVAILFRSRDSHRDFEAALDRRGVTTYVYKGLGFFEADEIQDAVALLRYLADPHSNLRAATLLRSRVLRLSDDAVSLACRAAVGRRCCVARTGRCGRDPRRRTASCRRPVRRRRPLGLRSAA